MIEPKLIYIPEPLLTFGYNQKMEDPRDGLTLFGPYSRNLYSGQINIGVIGPEKQRKYVIDYLKSIHQPIISSKPDIARPYFPGLEAALGIFVKFSAIRQIDVDNTKILEYLKYTDSYQRVFNLSNLYAEPLNKFAVQEEALVSVWFVAIPDDIYRFSRPKSKIEKAEDNIKIGLSNKDRKSNQPFLFEELNELKEAYDFEINFHNQLKAKLLSTSVMLSLD